MRGEEWELEGRTEGAYRATRAPKNVIARRGIMRGADREAAALQRPNLQAVW